MYKGIKIKNLQRIEKRESRFNKENYYLTPPKHQVKQSREIVYSKFQDKFGYNYDSQNSKTLKYLQEDFKTKTFAYLGNRNRTKKLGNKEKYQRNLKYGNPLKKNPLIKIFSKLQTRIVLTGKAQGLAVLKDLM